ncbi:MAG: S41 family peptidase [Candidatus Nealsonbacteria bacterium]
MSFFNKKNITLGIITLLIFISFAGGFFFGKFQIPPAPIEGVINQELGKPEGVDFSLFWDAWRALEAKYVDSEDINYQEMVYGAISGMVSSLGDPYTVFLPPEESKIFKEDVSGEFQGVGMEIGFRNGELTVIAPLEGTPAKRAGLRAGDKIIKIDGEYSLNILPEEAVKLIRGEKETEVVLTILREDWSESKDFTIVRDVIEIPSITWEIKDSNIAYIKLYQFSQTARSDFNEVAIEILNSSADKIILDLRNNPGGYLEIAQDIAGWFLEKGQLVTIEDFGGKEENEEYKAKGNEKLLFYPLVVLINQGSASGSEILAGCLRDNRGIKLVGEKSFGKGSVQELTDLKEGSLKVTVAKWLTPNGTSISDVGLDPDYFVEITEEDYNQDIDPQLDKAIEIIRDLR